MPAPVKKPAVPVGFGALCLVLIAVLVNNLSSHRKYPYYWF